MIKQETLILNYVSANTVVVQVIIFKQIVSTYKDFYLNFLSNSADEKIKN